MSELNYNVRMTQKIDTEKNWINSNLVPKEGEIIIYAAEDSTTELPTGRTTPISSPRVKVGNGVSTARDLPFFTLDYNSLLNTPFIPTYIAGSGILIENNEISTNFSWEEF